MNALGVEFVRRNAVGRWLRKGFHSQSKVSGVVAFIDGGGAHEKRWTVDGSLEGRGKTARVGLHLLRVFGAGENEGYGSEEYTARTLREGDQACGKLRSSVGIGGS